MAKQHAPGFLKLVEEARGRIREVDIPQLVAWQSAGEPFVLVDVREESEWSAGHAAGAIHLSKGIIERDIESRIPDPSTRIVLYCGGGYRSALAADNLQRMGYANVYSLIGGWRAWLDAHLPITRGS